MKVLEVLLAIKIKKSIMVIEPLEGRIGFCKENVRIIIV